VTGKCGVTVLRAWTQRGWSSTDHMIDDRRMDELVGMTFQSLRDAMRAAESRADSLGYAAIEYQRPDGQVWQRGAEPSLPGREPLHRRVR
jgi:hypothetical protein